jgi:hypothetical protein
VVTTILSTGIPVTRDEALRAMTLPADATTETTESRYRELYSEFQIRLTNAPTEPLKRVYQQRLRELEEARSTLAAPVANQSMDLPASAPVQSSEVEEVASDETTSTVVADQKPRRATLSYVWRGAAAFAAVFLLLRLVGVARARTPGAAKAGDTSKAGVAPATKPRKSPTPAAPVATEAVKPEAKPVVKNPPLSDNRVLLVAAGDESSTLSDGLRAALAKNGFDIAAGDDEASEARNGTSWRVDRLRAAATRRGARLVAMASVFTTPSPAANEFGMASADATIEVKVVDAFTGEILASRQSHQTGAGTSAVGAASNAVRRAMEQVVTATASELAARRR